MPGTPITIETAQGSTFTFGSATFRAKVMDRTSAVTMIDTSDCAQAEGDLKRMQPSPLKEPGEVNLECWGLTTPTEGTVDTLTCTKLGITGVRAACQKVTVKGEAGGLMSFTAQFLVIAAD